MGDVLIVMLPALILATVLWAAVTALKPRNHGISEAERYQQELALKSQAHYAAQVRAAEASRARIEATTRPSQNSQQQSQQADHARSALLGRDGSGHQDALSAIGHLNPTAPPAAPVTGPRRPQDEGRPAAAAIDPLGPEDRKELRRSALAHGLPAHSRTDPGARGRRRAAGGTGVEPPRRTHQAGTQRRSRTPTPRSWPGRRPPGSPRSSTGSSTR